MFYVDDKMARYVKWQTVKFLSFQKLGLCDDFVLQSVQTKMKPETVRYRSTIITCNNVNIKIMKTISDRHRYRR